ncbi:hypothetical protein [Promineifilum sp.]|uniref:hypothetical protein n=1 Tax=Promineifilum sp. TaxID=2664178 RepID=UPI0035AEA94C
MTKKVIFIGGTSYSGSTFFQLTLANDPAGFGAGEVRHLFRPTKERFLRDTWTCGCGDPACTVWDRVKQRGEAHLYETIFDMHPEVEFIVDASKNIVWMDQQRERLARQGIEVYPLIIWKTLLEFAHSLRKRKRLGLEELSNWPRYHRTYYSFIEDWRSIKYANYTHDQANVLRAVCAHLGIPYFEGKERFWEKRHHVLGGNLSSRIHLYSKDSEKYEDIRRRARGQELGQAETEHRRVYYEEPDQTALHQTIAELSQKEPRLGQIEAMLSNRDVANSAPLIQEWPDLRLSNSEIRMRQLRQYTQDHWGKIRYALRKSKTSGKVATQ